MKITLCVAIPEDGERLFELLAHSALHTCTGTHDVFFDFTTHSAIQADAIRSLNWDGASQLGKSYVVERCSASLFQKHSVTHSRCINEMFRGVDSEIAVICDFDIAFVSYGWDQTLVDILTSGADFFGTPNASNTGFILNGTPTRRVQNVPNAMFVAFDPKKIRIVSDRICDFYERYNTPDLPFHRVDNEIESKRFGLPVGSFVQIDTGTLIPELIQVHGLSVKLLEHNTHSYRVLQSAKLPPDYPHMLLPEEYSNDDEPFIVHYRKGSRKRADVFYAEDSFATDVDNWLQDQEQKSL